MVAIAGRVSTIFSSKKGNPLFNFKEFQTNRSCMKKKIPVSPVFFLIFLFTKAINTKIFPILKNYYFYLLFSLPKY